jgi:pyrroline-5-carboxylate reductase
MNTTETDLAIAGGAIASALIQTLVSKGILSKDDAVASLNNAMRQTANYKAFGASTVITHAIQAVNRTG